jgi:hypothetical protein
MNNANFYLFKGDWYKRYIEIAHLVEMEQKRLLAIWTPKDKSKNYNLLVLSDAELPQSYCFDNRIWKTDDTVFESFYRQKVRNYNVYINYDFQNDLKEPSASFAEPPLHLLTA